jgi:hypothetical protein
VLGVVVLLSVMEQLLITSIYLHGL